MKIGSLQLVRSIFPLAIVLSALSPGIALGQDDTVKLEPRIELNYFQVNNGLPYLTTRVRVKKDSRWEPVKWVIVNLFLKDETKLGMMGNITSDLKGEGTYILPAKFKVVWDSQDVYTFIARIKGDDKAIDGKKEITIKRSSLEVVTTEEDSVRKIQIVFKERKANQWIGVPEIELKAFINRNFGKLTVGEDTYTTGEDGKVEVEFAVEIPGDEKGNIAVGASVEDNDNYGNLTSTQVVAWGLPLKKQNDFFSRRTLWSTRDKTPVWLLIFPNLMILLVWGIIGYLVYNIRIMKQIQRKSFPRNL